MGASTLTEAPRVSVIVPVRDRRALLRRTLDALAAQTFRDFEVVVVDDRSTDGSALEVERDAAAGRPVRLVVGNGSGAVAARRMGVEAAQGDILAFTDSDCEPSPRWLEAATAMIDSGADLVQGPTLPARPFGPLERCTVAVREDGLYQTSNAVYRRSAYQAAGGFDAAAGDRLGFRVGRSARGLGFGEDTLLGWRIRRAGRTAFAEEAVVRHAVLPPDLGDLLHRAWVTGAFPTLVQEVPELRRTLLHRRLFLGATRPPLYAAMAAALLRRRALSAGLVGIWLHRHWRRSARPPTTLRRRLAVLPVQLGRDVMVAVALAAGSLRARTPVL